VSSRQLTKELTAAIPEYNPRAPNQLSRFVEPPRQTISPPPSPLALGNTNPDSSISTPPYLSQQFYNPILSTLAEVSDIPPLPTPTPHQLTHLYKPHQTPQERNVSAKFCSGFNIVWLRTCYTPSLSDAYYALENEAGARVEGGCLGSPQHILDDVAIYAFGGSDQEILDRLLLRMPGLTDAMGVVDEYGDGSLLLYGSGKNDIETGIEIETVGLEVQNLVYVVDQEALEKGVVKIWWFDEVGTIVWDNVARVPESDLWGVRGAMLDGQGFVDLVGEESGRGDVIRL
jgi:hypothetical protein